MDYLLVAVCLLLSSQGWSSAQNIPVDVQPREQVVREGDAVQFVCRVGQAIEFCRIELPSGQGVNLRPNMQATNLGIEYFGEGFQAGQCGLKLQRTDATHNGNFKCSMALSSSIYEAAGAMKLTVARPPQAPELRVYSRYQELNEGESLEATCVVRNGRPAANITWFIGEELVTQGLAAPKIVSEQPELFSVAQNLSRPVSWHDHGKKLRCVAQHIGSPEERGDQFTEADIQVRFPPQPMMGRSGPVEQYGFEEGREGVVTLEVAANPQPNLKWRVNGHELVEGERSAEYEVEQAQQIESGKWAARLRINKVTAADIDKDFKLTAANELGEQIYTVKISTSPGAAETDLGIVGIVAIVIAVLIIFLLVLLVCFARITGRWCFAAGVPMRSDKESGGALHSSDTESADHAPAIQDKQPSKFKLPAFLTKSSKTAAAAAKQTPLDEVKTISSDDSNKPPKSDAVVYAELDLARGGRKPHEIPTIRREDDKTEYAEIVHTKQPQA